MPKTQTIARKLAKLVLTALGVSFAVTALTAAWMDATAQARLESERLVQTARVIGSLSAEAVAQKDRAGAFQAVRSISQMPSLSYARLETREGFLLAETGSGARLLSDLSVERDGRPSLWQTLRTGSIEASAPVLWEGTEVGKVTLFGRTPDLRTRILAALLPTLLGALVAMLAALVVALRMARKISAPIVALAGQIGEVRRTSRFEAQGDIAADGEVRDLVDGFKDLLGSIRERDARIADQIDNLEAEVASRTVELSDAKQEAEAANAAKSDFLAVMSHEIRTPLNGILALSDLLARTALPPKAKRYADIISNSGRSLLNIINEILDFSKVEAGKLELEAIETDLGELIEDVADLFAVKAQEKGLDLATYVDPTLGSVAADPVRLRQVVSNLLNNALKFTETGGVLLSVERAGEPGRIRISVEDTGPGIPADRLPTLFEAFTQADQSTTRRYGGTGLGLTICDRLVGAMGGRWELDSVVGQGSTFAFSLPVSEVSAAAAPMSAPAGWSVGLGALDVMTGRAVRRYLGAYGVSEAPLEVANATLVGPNEEVAGLGVRIGAKGGDDDSSLARPLRRAVLEHALQELQQGRKPEWSGAIAQTGAGVAFPGVRVLVVDDSEVNREVASEALASLGIEADTAVDGLEAVTRVAGERFDLVLMDGSMPVMDGFEAARRIRAQEQAEGRSPTPIYALTAHVIGAAAQAWREAGMNGVVHKPFTTNDLVEVLNAVCGDRSQAAIAAAPQSAAEPVAVSADDLFDAATRADLQRMAQQGRPDFVERVERLYLDNAPLRLAELTAAAGDGQLDAVARAAHALKSMSLSLGARVVAALAAGMEASARQGEAISAEQVEAIADCLDRTMLELGGAPAEPSGPLAELEQGLACGELEMHYQALMNPKGEFSGKVEALVRWTCSRQGRRSPADFIPALEKAGAIARLTDFALERAMTDILPLVEVRVSINASADEFQSADFADRVAAVMRKVGFPPERLEIEVTETAMLNLDSARQSIEALRALGVGVALDDFGAGFTSLHALRDLKFATLKVDASFIAKCCEDTASAAILHAVISVGRALGMKVVCEGVETAEQASFLRIAGAHLLQGYHFHRPQPVGDLAETLGLQGDVRDVA
ncbi:EAL domain-containing protein [Brevundimonas sp. PAMC22021]|uniref:EAL domain-containing protein n=1 Tax=Brevundimonas sp. PAMC22021 TaxID=2861285 RepID=UPI001C62867F|nr:EAL domain-containing protein [Brevundimonas sp. PAMC22021]QYF87590.1 EAL domain-containing protein [Brevundimonas sp. PAMC22021]